MRRALVLLVLSVGCSRDDGVVDLEGRAIDPIRASEDGVAVLVFVASDCPISNRYAPTLASLSERFVDRGVAFFAVYPDPDDDAQVVDDHRRAYDLRFTAVRDPEHALARRVGARVTPEAAVYVDEAQVYRGRIDDRAIAFGNFRPRAEHDDLSLAIEAALAGVSIDPAITDAVGCYIADLK